MQTSHKLGAGVLLAAIGWFAASAALPSSGDAASHALAAGTPPAIPAEPPVANGHWTLVVDGDRDRLTITGAVRKNDPWAGVPKGLKSAWTIVIDATDGSRLAEVPLDLVHFDTAPARKGGAVAVQGCVVRDPHVAMLVNVPAFASAASYTFVRRDAEGIAELGTVTAARVTELAGGGR